MSATIPNPFKPQVLTAIDADSEQVRLAQEQHHKRYKETPKFLRWRTLFLDKNNKKTFGNQAQSALEAYGLDPDTQYQTACIIGHQNARKHKHISQEYLTKQGINAGMILDVLWNKAVSANDLKLMQWFIDFMEVDLPRLPIAETEKEKGANVQVNMISGLNLAQLTDDQLKQFIAGKRAELARRGGPSAVGDGTQNAAVTTSVQSSAPQTT